MEFIGWTSSIALAVCALPQTWYTIKTGDTSSFTWSFLFLWTLGDLGLLVYTFPLNSYALTFNYGLNAFAVGIILCYKLTSLYKSKTKKNTKNEAVDS